MPPKFDPKRLRVERFNIDWHYHATYTWFGLRGVVAERWAHGPVFGGVADLGGQLNLTPDSKEDDAERLVGVVGLRASAMVGEGKRRSSQARDTWRAWFGDIEAVLKPIRSVRVGVDFLGLYPVKDEWAVTQRIKNRYYNNQALDELAGVSAFHAGPEIFEAVGRRRRTIQMGVLGPPHRGTYFNFEDRERDERWWLALRVHYGLIDDDGLAEPLSALSDVVASLNEDWLRISERVFPDLIA